MSIDERGVEGHLSIEKSRVWDLKSTGQVSTSGKSAAGICCICFHPTDPTLCVVTVQGMVSVLSFYNAHSGGRMSTVPLQSVVAVAQFTKDGNQIVVIFRDWTVMILTPGSPVWSKGIIPFKKDTKPAENLILALSPATLPVIYFVSAGQQRVNVILSSAPSPKGSLLGTSQKNNFMMKLTNSGITGLACHPEEADILFAAYSDGAIQALVLEQFTLKKLFSVGEGVHVSRSNMSQFEVVPHPFIPGAALILSSAGRELLIYALHGRENVAPVDRMALKEFKKITGMGIHKEAHVLLVFGELLDGKLTCNGARLTANESAGISLVPVNVTFSPSATDVIVPSHSTSGVVNVSDRGNGSWMELWDVVPAWAQSASHGASRQRIRSVQMHPTMGAIAAQSAAAEAGGSPHVLLWSVNDASHPLGGSNTGLVVPQHTPLSLWAGPSTGTEYKLEFPHRCYFAAGTTLSGYSLRSKEVTDVMAFGPPKGKSGPAIAETVVFSTWHRAWLIFFRSFSANPPSNGIEEWTYTLQREDEVGASAPWFKPGISGVFIGPKEDHCCILDPDLFTVHVFPTKTVSGRDSPLLSLSLPAPGLLTPALFQGPPITQIPKPPPSPEFTASGNLVDILQNEEEAANEKLGYGVIIWVNKFREIAMGTMVSEPEGRRTWHESETLQYIQGGTFNELSDGEIIIQVAWQVLSDEQEAQQAPNSFTAAVLTNQRLMIFLANGYPVLSFPPQNSPGLYSPPKSCLWVGPALLYVTRTGEVNQLLWDGSTVMICGAPSTTGSAVLAAALADRILFLCRETQSRSWQVSTRYAIIGYALLMGWASLASSGLMPPAWLHAHARHQMKMVLQHYDASTVSAPVARALVQSGFADVARLIANSWSNGAQKIQVACNVAAQCWKEAAEGLQTEYQNSVYHPGPIPRESTMWKRFYSVAMGAVRNGEAEIGADLFTTAGEWEWALVFLSLTSKTSKISQVLKTAEAYVSSEELSRLQSLTDQLKKRSLALTGAAADVVAPSDSAFEDLKTWTLAARGYLPPMFCIQGATPKGMIKDGDIGVIDPLETTDIKGYVSGASKQASGNAFIRRTVTNTISGKGGFAKASVDRTNDTLASLDVGGAPSFKSLSNSKAGTPKMTTTAASAETSRDVPHGFSDLGLDDNFSSDDDDEANSTQDFGRNTAGFGKKFKIQIKKKEDSHGGTSSEALREAAKNLRLGGFNFGPSLGPSGFAAAMKGGVDAAESVSSVSSSHSQLEPKLNPGHRIDALHDQEDRQPVPKLEPPSPSSALRSTTDLFGSGDPFAQRGSSVEESFRTGVAEMEGGRWAPAVDAFSKPGVLNVPRAKQYLAAVLLLKERTTLSGGEAARLDRYAASLELEHKHKTAMTLQAVRENMEIGNYGYAKKRLQWLLESAPAQTPSQTTTAFQKQLQECEKHHLGMDNDISPFENLESVPKRVESVNTVDELKVMMEAISF